MKPKTPHHHSVHFLCCANCYVLMLFFLVLGCWSLVTQAEQPSATRTGQGGKPDTKEKPPIAQEDEGSDPQLPGSGLLSPETIISAPFGTSFQVNVSGGQNMVGDAANEAMMCIDPNNPNHIAIGWRQFDSTN